MTMPTGYLYGMAKMLDTYRDQLVNFIAEINKRSGNNEKVRKLMHDIAMADNFTDLDAYIRKMEQEIEEWK